MIHQTDGKYDDDVGCPERRKRKSQSGGERSQRTEKR